MKDKRSHSEELLRRWLDGRLTAREEAELDRAAQEDPWLAEALAGYRAYAEAEHVEALERLRRQLRPEVKRSRLLPIAWRIAAIGLVLLAAAWWIWEQPLTSADQQTPLAAEGSTTEEAPEEAVVALDEPTSADSAAEDISDTYLAEASSPEPEPRQGKTRTQPDSYTIKEHEEALADQLESRKAKQAELASRAVAEREREARANAIVLGAPPPPPPPPPAPAATVVEEAASIAEDDTLAPTWDDLPAQRTRTLDPAMITNMGRTEASPGYFLVEGKVIDQDGYPLIGASILDMGSNRGVVTGVDGQFQLAIDTTTRQVQVSYTGFSTETVLVSPERKQVEVVLEDAAGSLEEVVVTALGAGRKKEVGSASETVGQEADTVVPKVRPVEGYRAFRRYLRDSTPSDTPSGRVRLAFRILADGTVDQIKVVDAPNDRLADLAVQLVTGGPRWEIKEGVAPVEVEYVIRFRE